jgi:hypothetical protein
MSKPKSRGISPFPVYVATLADGRIVRMSFWTAKKAKGFDFEDGRRTIAACYSRQDSVASNELTPQEHERAVRGARILTPRQREDAANFWKVFKPIDILDGYVEHPTVGRIRDPHFEARESGAVQPIKRPAKRKAEQSAPIPEGSVIALGDALQTLVNWVEHWGPRTGYGASFPELDTARAALATIPQSRVA